ncbi:MAG TPA: cyclodeaminase/cyclohydrolase family protein [Candidatus Baltobacteraceae bacterium]|nr:cyclodeaminase/cyclohydrolase family protein [Candidatus Baltobacteraceae bacterium]
MEALREYLVNLASESPAPGGGSAAMVVGATGCALVAMVARICAASPKYEAKRALASELVAQADRLRADFLERKARDERAFDAVVAARGDKEAMQRALAGAAAVPLEGAQAALEALRLGADAIELGNANLMSDVGCAAEFAYAALLACAYNVRINHKFMKDEHLVATQQSELSELEKAARPLLHAVRSALT